MNTVVKIEPKDIDAVPFQDASLDIWDKKYRLTAKDGTPIDKSMDDTYKRVARALADVEAPEARYTLECFPMLFAAGGIAFAGLLSRSYLSKEKAFAGTP